jgi:acetyl esterase/lipase
LRGFSGVVAVAGLNGKALLIGGEIDLMIASSSGILRGCVTEAVLGAQLFGDLGVDLGYVLILLDLEESAAGLVDHALEVLFAVGAPLRWGVVASASVAAGVASTPARVAAAGVTSSGIAASRVATARVAAAALVLVVVGSVLGLVAFEVDGVDDGVGALGGFDGADEVFAAAVVAAVGEDDEGFATLLLRHDLVGGEEEGVVEDGAAMGSAVAAGVVGVVGIAGGTRGVGGVGGSVDLLERGLELGTGGGEVLKEFGLAGELNHEGLVLRRGEHLVEKYAAGAALVVEDAALGDAGVNQQTEDQREVGVFVEVADGLGLAVDLEGEVVLGEVLDEGALFITDDHREVDETGVDGEGGDRAGGLVWRGGGGGLLLGRERGRECKNKKQAPDGVVGVHVELDDGCGGGFQQGGIMASRPAFSPSLEKKQVYADGIMRQIALLAAGFVCALCCVGCASVSATAATAPAAGVTKAPQGAARAVVLWPAGAPEAIGKEDGDVPKLYVYPATGPGLHAAVIVLPGGGYTRLMTEKEGAVEARWLNAHGVTAFVLEYRLGPRYRFPAPMLDGGRAVRYVRSHAREMDVAEDKIGLWGFSAGAHLAGYLAAVHDRGASKADDPVDRASDRPDFVIVSYGRFSMDDSIPRKGNMDGLLGKNPTRAMLDAISVVRLVTRDTSPCFIYSTTADQTVDSLNATAFYDALKREGVPVELHIFERGQHGTGMGQGLKGLPELAIYPTLLENWMEMHGWMAES